LLFEGQGKVTCAVRSDTNIFDPGFNRMDGYWEAVGRVPHPAYVFQLSASDDTPQQIDQLKARMAAGDPRFAGYTFAAVHSFTVAYYAGG
jgi:hypothetical protein